MSFTVYRSFPSLFKLSQSLRAIVPSQLAAELSVPISLVTKLPIPSGTIMPHESQRVEYKFYDDGMQRKDSSVLVRNAQRLAVTCMALVNSTPPGQHSLLSLGIRDVPGRRPHVVGFALSAPGAYIESLSKSLGRVRCITSVEVFSKREYLRAVAQCKLPCLSRADPFSLPFLLPSSRLIADDAKLFAAKLVQLTAEDIAHLREFRCEPVDNGPYLPVMAYFNSLELCKAIDFGFSMNTVTGTNHSDRYVASLAFKTLENVNSFGATALCMSALSDNDTSKPPCIFGSVLKAPRMDLYALAAVRHTAGVAPIRAASVLERARLVLSLCGEESYLIAAVMHALLTPRCSGHLEWVDQFFAELAGDIIASDPVLHDGFCQFYADECAPYCSSLVGKKTMAPPRHWIAKLMALLPSKYYQMPVFEFCETNYNSRHFILKLFAMWSELYFSEGNKGARKMKPIFLIGDQPLILLGARNRAAAVKFAVSCAPTALHIIPCY